jgi:hypothetical protein
LELQVCTKDRTGFGLEQQCASATLCSVAGGCLPAACAANERRCQGAQLQVCSADRSGFVLEQQCASAAACDLAGCRPATACAVNELRCSGAVLQQCSADRSGFEQLSNCGNPQLCNQAAGRCDACVPGARRCLDAATVAVCAASGLTEDITACGLLGACSDGMCGLGLPL